MENTINPVAGNRGFVTIATGDIRYYEVTHNLLLSYRWFARRPMPFAIICDEENEFTSDFDDVIHIDNPRHSFLDKLRLPELAPYDETIFIDADCLAYRDLNGLWRLFNNSGGFAALGEKYSLDSGKGWITREGAGIYRNRVKFSLVFNGGVYFLRKNDLGEFSKTCEFILDHYDSFNLSYPYKAPVDEPVFALACSVHGFDPALCYVHVYCYYPYSHAVEADIRKGKLFYPTASNQPYPSYRYMVHWSMKRTKEELYGREVASLKSVMKSRGRAPLCLEIRNRFMDFFLMKSHGFLKRLPYGFKAKAYQMILGRIRHSS